MCRGNLLERKSIKYWTWIKDKKRCLLGYQLKTKYEDGTKTFFAHVISGLVIDLYFINPARQAPLNKIC